MKLPKSITGPYASRVDGTWKSHRNEGGAWRRAWNVAGARVVRVVEPGKGEPLDPPKDRPKGKGGEVTGIRFLLTVSEDELATIDRAASKAGEPRATWAKNVIVSEASRKTT